MIKLMAKKTTTSDELMSTKPSRTMNVDVFSSEWRVVDHATADRVHRQGEDE
jgi:hypothetical protein